MRICKLNIFWVLLALLWNTSVITYAQVTIPVFDPFNYTVGSLTTNGGWASYNSGTEPTVVSGSLSYPGLVASTFNRSHWGGLNGKEIDKKFTSTTTGTIYYSFVLNLPTVNSTTEYFMGLRGGAQTTYGACVWAKPASGSYTLGLSGRSSTAATYNSTSFTNSSMVFVVVGFQVASSGTAKMWINPTLGLSTEPTADITITGVSGMGTVDGLFLRSSAATSSVYEMDELRIATSWSAVTPASGPGATINTAGSLTSFLASGINIASAEQNFQVSGTNLTDNLSVAPPTGYEISTQTGINFTPTNPIVLTPSSGSVSFTTIYVRLKHTVSGPVSGSITCSSTGATNVTVPVTGTVATSYYNVSGNPVNLTTSWGTNTDGSGTQPANFTADAQLFNIVNGSTATMNNDWTVSGTSSKVVVGNGSANLQFIIPDPYTVTGTIDVTASAQLTISSAVAPAFTLGTVAALGTIEYAQAGSYTVPQSVSFGNLILKNGTKSFAGGTTTILGNLTFDGMTLNAPGASPFATINVGGNVTYLNTVTNPADANSITLVATSSGTQTITGNGNLVRLFRIQTNNAGCNVVLASGASRNLSSALLGNASGGGLQLATGTTLTINNNTLSLFAGKTTFISSGKLIGSAASNLVLANSGSTVTMGTFYFNTGDELLDSLTLNISGTTPTATLGSNLTVNSAVNLNAGVLILGANNLTLGSSAVINGGSASSFIAPAAAGVLRVPFSAVGAFTFHVGDASLGYSPVTLTFNSGSFSSAYVDIKLSKAKQTNNFSTTDYINRFWTLTPANITGFNANVSAKYLQTDVVGSEANIYTGQFDGASWNTSGLVDATNDLVQFTGLTSLGDFTGGERVVMYNAGSVVTTAIPEGYYNTTTGKLNIKDTLKAYLANTTAPFAFIDSANVVLDSVTFSGKANFFNAASGTYYLVIKGRGVLETWSKTGGETFTKGANATYDFTSAATQAFDSKQVLVGTKYCLYSGDVNQDGSINYTDLNLVDTDSHGMASGYNVNDLNGDGFVDFSDMVIVDNNSHLQIVKSVPVTVSAKPAKANTQSGN